MSSSECCSNWKVLCIKIKQIDATCMWCMALSVLTHSMIWWVLVCQFRPMNQDVHYGWKGCISLNTCTPWILTTHLVGFEDGRAHLPPDLGSSKVVGKLGWKGKLNPRRLLAFVVTASGVPSGLFLVYISHNSPPQPLYEGSVGGRGEFLSMCTWIMIGTWCSLNLLSVWLHNMPEPLGACLSPKSLDLCALQLQVYKWYYANNPMFVLSMFMRPWLVR